MFLTLFSAFTFLLAESKTEININNSVNSVENNVSVSTNSNGSSVVKINNNSFEIEGTIDSVSSAKFSVDTQSISKSENIGGADNIQVGNKVKVKGTIKNSILFAEELNLMSKNKAAPTPAPVISLTPAKSASPSPIFKPDLTKSNNFFTSFFRKLQTFFRNIF